MSTPPPTDGVELQSGSVGIHVDISPLPTSHPSPTCAPWPACDVLAQTGVDATAIFVVGVCILFAGAIIVTTALAARRRVRARE